MAVAEISCSEPRATILKVGCHCGAAERLAQALRHGDIVLSNTETVPGLHAWRFSERALNRLCSYKGRDSFRFIHLFPDFASAEMLADLSEFRIADLERLVRNTAMPVTFVVPRQDEPSETAAIRVPKDPVLGRVLREVFPVLTPSANPPGGRTPGDLGEVDPGVQAFADVRVRFPVSTTGWASTVVDLTVRPAAIRRHGGIWEGQFQSVLRTFLSTA